MSMDLKRLFDLDKVDFTDLELELPYGGSIMNIQEVIDKIEASKYSKLIYEYDGWKEEKKFNSGLDCALSYIKQLNEPEKPVVPQFVADFYESIKDDFEYSLYKLCTDFNEHKLHEDLHKWFDDNNNKSIETLVLMHKFGYEVKKQEKLYTVELPNPNYTIQGHYILYKNEDGKVCLDYNYFDDWKNCPFMQLTESEIKQDFSWAWQLAEEVK